MRPSVPRADVGLALAGGLSRQQRVRVVRWIVVASTGRDGVAVDLGLLSEEQTLHPVAGTNTGVRSPDGVATPELEAHSPDLDGLGRRDQASDLHTEKVHLPDVVDLVVGSGVDPEDEPLLARVHELERHAVRVRVLRHDFVRIEVLAQSLDRGRRCDVSVGGLCGPHPQHDCHRHDRCADSSQTNLTQVVHESS